MPNYEYKCHNCETIFLKIMTFKEFDKLKDNKLKCVHCGKKKATRVVLSSPTIEFVGEGFYSNDKDNKNE